MLCFICLTRESCSPIRGVPLLFQGTRPEGVVVLVTTSLQPMPRFEVWGVGGENHLKQQLTNTLEKSAASNLVFYF